MIQNQRGFTVIELAIVILILGVIGTISIPKFIDLRENAQASANLGYIAGIRSQMSINFTAERLGKAVCVTATTLVANTRPPVDTTAALENCVTGTRPASLTRTSNTRWTGLAPLLAGGNPTTVTWTIRGAPSVGGMVYIRCSSILNQC